MEQLRGAGTSGRIALKAEAVRNTGRGIKWH